MRWGFKKIIVTALAVLVFSNINGISVQSKSVKMRVIAHRGLVSEAPENTVSSILSAAKRKVDYAELDVQETKDGYVVLMHDKGLKRVAGINKCVCNMNYKELEKVDVGRLYSKKYKGERVPTLEKVILAAKGKIKLDIEIKCYGREKDLTEKVVALIDKNNFQDQCIVTSFDYDVLKYVKKLDPKIKTSYITFSRPKDISIKDKDIDIYSVEKNHVDAKFINKIHRYKKQIHVWTVDNINEIDKFLNLKVDYVITNNI